MGMKLKKMKRLLVSRQGAAIVLLALFLIPLITFAIAFAIDLSMYLGVSAYLNNAIDTVSVSALNKSAIDSYRADKTLKLKSEDFYVSKVKEELDKNFKVQTWVQDASASNDYTFKFISGIDFIPNEISLRVNYMPSATGGGQEYVVQDNNYDGIEDAGAKVAQQHSTDQDIELNLSTKVDLPILGGIASMFSLNNLVRANMNINNTVRGIRVQTPGETKFR